MFLLVDSPPASIMMLMNKINFFFFPYHHHSCGYVDKRKPEAFCSDLSTIEAACPQSAARFRGAFFWGGAVVVHKGLWIVDNVFGGQPPSPALWTTPVDNRGAYTHLPDLGSRQASVVHRLVDNPALVHSACPHSLWTTPSIYY